MSEIFDTSGNLLQKDNVTPLNPPKSFDEQIKSALNKEALKTQMQNKFDKDAKDALFDKIMAKAKENKDRGESR